MGMNSEVEDSGPCAMIFLESWGDMMKNKPPSNTYRVSAVSHMCKTSDHEWFTRIPKPERSTEPGFQPRLFWSQSSCSFIFCHEAKEGWWEKGAGFGVRPRSQGRQDGARCLRDGVELGCLGDDESWGQRSVGSEGFSIAHYSSKYGSELPVWSALMDLIL